MKMKPAVMRRLFAWMMTAALICGSVSFPARAQAADSESKIRFEKVDNSAVSGTLQDKAEISEQKAPYANTDTVRVSIVLKDSATTDKFSTEEIAENKAAMFYRSRLAAKQDSVAARISNEALDGEDLDVVWNLTLAANIISANVRYGDIEAIADVEGVEKVVVENRYAPAVVNREESVDPNMATSSTQIGSTNAYLAGYTGAGQRIAVIDTGWDPDHISFDGNAFEYSLKQLAEAAGKDYDTYVKELDLLDADEIAGKLDKLNVSSGYSNSDLYINSKIGFAYNYVDEDIDTSHDNDTQGEHGSHVAGIATANAYVTDGKGGYVSALDQVKTQGVAPDAQLIVMKVFGKGGGAYDSDYMAAIEDALVLGADAVNLSLGSGNPGYSSSGNDTYETILSNLIGSDTVVTISAGNAGGWIDNGGHLLPGYLYADDVSMQTSGSPGTYTNSLGVASVDNDGATGPYVAVNGNNIIYTETSGSNQPFTTIAGEYEYVLIDDIGSAEQFAAIKDVLKGKIAVCKRGEIAFTEKAENAVANGAVATIIYNNEAGTISMDMTAYTRTQPCVSITQAEGAFLMESAENKGGYYVGKMTVSADTTSNQYDSKYYTMSDFSSWGVPGSLKLKPEITAPGGNIYSVNGIVPGGQAYENMSGTSMAAPQVAGMAALVAQYIKDKGLDEKTGLSIRTLSQSLLMSTAVPMLEEQEDGAANYWSVLRQGAGLANVGNVISADSYIMMDESATESVKDGKVKAELGDDENREGKYSVSFTINNLTDEDKAYELSADWFTQGIFPYYVNEAGDVDNYMDTWTTDLANVMSWTVDGKSINQYELYDFDGDGDEDLDDVDAILQYVVGTRTELFNKEKADYDKDGAITSYDAYLALSTGKVVVPASGSVKVTVDMALTTEQKEALNEDYINGAYIEGYIHVKPEATEEGVVGVAHSIPVLGYYGDWSEPSMFEVGSYLEYEYGIEKRLPYLESTDANYFIVSRSDGKPYYFGGNPILDEETYYPERNAINSINGDSLSQIGYSLIRNAAAGRISVTKQGETEPVYEKAIGQTFSAYYYDNGGTWQYTNYSADISWDMKDAKEGEAYIAALTMATEYDVKPDGTVDWANLKDGASLAIPFTIDNTAPEIEDVVCKDTNSDGKDDEISVSITENQYVAGVVFWDAYGKDFIAGYTLDQDKPGVETTVDVEASDLEGDNVYLLQVYDYANNCTTYRVFLNMEPTDEVESVTLNIDSLNMMVKNTALLQATVGPANIRDSRVTWTSSDETIATVNENGVVTAHKVGECTITATSVLDNSKSADCAVTVIEINKDLNGVVWDEDGNVFWSQVNTTKLPDYTKLAPAGRDFGAATLDENGVLYAATLDTETATSTLYTVDPTTFAASEVGASDIFYADLAPAPYGMENVLYGVYLGYVVIIDRTTGGYIGAFNYCNNYLTGITYEYSFMHSNYNLPVDVYLITDVKGNVYEEAFMYMQGDTYYFMGQADALLGNSGVNMTVEPYMNSAYYDGSYLYYAGYDTKENRSELYAMDLNTGSTYFMGAFDNGVWPFAGLLELNQATTVNTSDRVSADLVSAKVAGVMSTTIPAEAKVKMNAIRKADANTAVGSLNAVTAGSKRAVSVNAVEESAEKKNFSISEKENDDTKVVAVVAQDVFSNNGKVVVTYNAEDLELVSVTGKVSHFAFNKSQAGQVVLAYADLFGVAAEGTVAELEFARKTTKETDVVANFEETNDKVAQSNQKTETLECKHGNVDHVKAVAPTCDKEGNVEYWYCASCGKYFADKDGTKEITKDETIIPVLKDEGNESGNGSGTGTGIKTGVETTVTPYIVLAVIAALAIIVLAVVMFVRKKRRTA